ncbi:hypothetical protein [Streptomyces olivochromogenes]|uniref:hypothetical protein n=1 Tax=Streptomyces olivochromogenes TaxID=1963 RepID=UPI001F1C45B5|nr:hypothetical protein [Streptomyces olivochromogenes]MCF3130796.1 hypothetical protein [Streptomyces olivochromogenes]
MLPQLSGLARGRHAVFVACLLALTGCNPHMYDDVPALHDAKPPEVAGSWLGYDRTHVVLRPDGKADIRLLDGLEWDFDDRWRLSGTGTWELTDKRTGWNDGQHVRLKLTSRTAVATRAPEPDDPPAPTGDSPRIPKTYTWTFELRRDDKKDLELYFFFHDPDSRSTYILQREGPGRRNSSAGGR